MTSNSTLLRLRFAALLSVSVLSLFLVACGRKSSGSNCTPGATVPCVAGGGVMGTRTCNATGMYGSCETGSTGSDGGMTMGDGGGMTDDGGGTGSDGGTLVGACGDVDITTLDSGLSSCLNECAFVTDFSSCFSGCFESFSSSASPACISCYQTRADCTNTQCVSVEACDPSVPSSCLACECGDNGGGVDCLTPFAACTGIADLGCGG